MRRLLDIKTPVMAGQGSTVMYHASGIAVQPLQRCFHFLMPAEPLGADRIATWQGKILELVNMIRQELRKSESKLADRMGNVERQVQEIRQGMRNLAETLRQAAPENELLATQADQAQT